MGLRLRAVILLVFVAVTASGATAWLTLREADRQVRSSLASEREDVDAITARLRELALVTGAWTGADVVVKELAASTGQRVRVVSATEEVLADSDVLSGRDPRPVRPPPVAVDVTPTLRLPGDATARARAESTLGAVARYRGAHAYADCLERAGAAVRWSVEEDGVPEVVVSPAGSTSCRRVGATVERAQADRLASLCEQTAPGDADCYQRYFGREVVDLVPEPVAVYVGADEDTGPQLASGPVAAVAVGVAAVILVAALLLARSLTRPLRRLTDAAVTLGEGDLEVRVPVEGHDEFATLAASFNAMADSLREAEERQRRLIGDVSHELRTPLSNLRGYLEAMRDGVLEPTPELIASLHEEVLHQRRLVDDLHELALAESGALTYRRERTDVAEVARGAVTAMLPMADEAGVRLVVDAPTGGDDAVIDGADPARLRQVMTNLLRNAVAATEGGGEVRVRVEPAAAVVEVDVADDGIGIAAVDLPHVFDRLWRADAARGRDGGSGLGLALSREIVRHHGGELTARSVVGEGATFTVRLPRPDRTGADQDP